jgi:surface carbohydrate biosynthesis protein (TIGR04326 family)
MQKIMNPVANSVFTVWDSESAPPEALKSVCFWNGYTDDAERSSILTFCEDNADRLRKKYCQWVYDLGQTSINGRRVVEHLALDGGLSYWWMTRFAEQSLQKSPGIVDAIRLFALEEILAKHQPDKVRLVSGDRRLDAILCDLCRNKGIAYEWEQIRVPFPWPSSALQLYRGLPQPIQASVYLVRQLRFLRPLKQSKKLDWLGGTNTLFICAPFSNLALDSVDTGHFQSHFWNGLHALIGRLGISENWLHLYMPYDASPRQADEWLRGFNSERPKESSHAFLESHLSWRTVFRVLRRWAKLLFESWRLRGIESAFRPKGSHFSLWPIMKKDWLASMRGPDSINSLLYVELFDTVFSILPPQKKGLYLCENQAWERAFLHAWRKHRHGQIIAVPHSTRSFWDIRFFRDPRVLESASYRLPCPDRIAINGKAALEVFRGENYSPDTIVECEALRYGHLENIFAKRSLKTGTFKVLVLGDYLASGTDRMLKLLEEAAPHVSAPATYTLKPHPDFATRKTGSPALRLEIVTEPLKDILHEFDLAYSGNMTSAAVDAYLAGLPVIVMLDKMGLNYSPLRGHSGVRFVGSPKELAIALQAAGDGLLRGETHRDFFFLDAGLPRWRKILAN